VDLNRCRDVGYQALERLDREQELTHQLDRIAPSRHAQWPKHDERSSARIRAAPTGSAPRRPPTGA
jgi:hypothetical protein